MATEEWETAFSKKFKLKYIEAIRGMVGLPWDRQEALMGGLFHREVSEQGGAWVPHWLLRKRLLCELCNEYGVACPCHRPQAVALMAKINNKYDRSKVLERELSGPRGLEESYFSGGMTALMQCARDDETKLVQELVIPDPVQGICEVLTVYLINMRATGPAKQGFTALSFAVEAGHRQLALLLMRQRADPDLGDEEGFTPLHLAAVSGRDDIATGLIRGKATVNCVSTQGLTPLHLMAGEGHHVVGDLLLQHNAEVDVPDETRGMTAVHFAALNGQQTAMRLLLEHHAGATTSDKAGCTPTHWACQRGHTAIVEILLELSSQRAADAKRQLEGLPAVQAMAENPNRLLLDIVMMPMRHLARIVQQEEDDQRARENGSPRGRMSTRQRQLMVQQCGGIAEQLLAEFESQQDQLTLHAATQGRKEGESEREDREKLQRSLQELGKRLGELQTLCVLEQNKIDECNIDGFSPLHLAALTGSSPAAILLAQHRADLHKQDTDGRTALDLANRAGHTNLATQLLELASEKEGSLQRMGACTPAARRTMENVLDNLSH